MLSGAYIGLLPGKGAGSAPTTFAGVETPPPKEGLVSGQYYTLIADRLSEISDGSPVYFHGVQVGEVTGHELSDRDGRVALHVFIYSPHPALINAQSRFWVSSGLSFSIGAQGVQIASAPLMAILIGGIVFDTPDSELNAKPSPPGSRFFLFADQKAADEAAEPTSGLLSSAVSGIAARRGCRHPGRTPRAPRRPGKRHSARIRCRGGRDPCAGNHRGGAAPYQGRR